MIASLFALQMALLSPAEMQERLDRIEPVPALPFQVSLYDEAYETYFDWAAGHVGVNTSECAKFVNRLFLARFGKMMFGNAWDLQLKPENQRWLELVWQLNENQFDRGNKLLLHRAEDRVAHFQELYDVLEYERQPVGVLGFMYRFSFYRDPLVARPDWLPQSHVAFLAGERIFEIRNEADHPLTVEQVVEATYAPLHDFERPFVAERLPLDQLLEPGESIFYDDYLVEEHFKKVNRGSLLEVFLTKHRNNKTTPLLRPVSYSRLTPQLRSDIVRQQWTLSQLGEVEYVSGKEFASLVFPGKKQWEMVLDSVFSLEKPERSLLVPVPHQVEVVAQ